MTTGFCRHSGDRGNIPPDSVGDACLATSDDLFRELAGIVDLSGGEGCAVGSKVCEPVEFTCTFSASFMKPAAGGRVVAQHGETEPIIAQFLATWPASLAAAGIDRSRPAVTVLVIQSCQQDRCRSTGSTLSDASDLIVNGMRVGGKDEVSDGTVFLLVLVRVSVGSVLRGCLFAAEANPDRPG